VRWVNLLLLFLDTRSQVVSRICGRDDLVKHLNVASFFFVFETAVPHAVFIGSPRSAR
jgi:hypothetical protein